MISVRRRAGTLLYRFRTVRQRHGLGLIGIRSNRLTGRWIPLWCYAEDVTADATADVWRQIPVFVLDRLPLCTTRSQVEQLLTPASSAVRDRGVERVGGRPGGTGVAAIGSAGPVRPLSPRRWAGRVLNGRRRAHGAGEWAGMPVQRSARGHLPGPGRPWPLRGAR